MPNPTHAHRAPPSTLVLEGLCVSFGLWTLSCHLTVALAGNLFTLLTIFLAALIAAWGGWFYLRVRSDASRHLTFFEPEHRLAAATPSGTLPQGTLALALGAACVIAFTYWRTADILWFWGLTLLFFGAGILLDGSPKFSLRTCQRSWSAEAVLTALGVACALLTLYAHRSSSDDTVYVNMAVSVADHPHRPVLLYDTMLGVSDLKMHLPVYRLHAIEVLEGAISFLTGIPAIQVAHWVVPSLVAFLVPFALARFFRLIGRHYLWPTLAVVAFYCLEGSAYSGFSNHAFVRLQHGKAIFLTLFVPLLLVLAVRCAHTPSPRRWLLLLLAQIGSIGLTSTGIWMAPLIAGLAMMSVWRPNWSHTKHLAIALTTSGYSLVAGLLVRGATQTALGSGHAQAFVPPIHHWPRNALVRVLGNHDMQAAVLASLLIGWILFRRRRFARRFLLTYMLVFFVAPFNPWLAPLVRTFSPFYWRIFWVLPVPLFVALSFDGLRVTRGPRLTRWLSTAVTSSAFIALLLRLPAVGTLSRTNAVFIKSPPKLKVPTRDFAAAKQLNRLAATGSYVLAPTRVAVWVTTQHHHAFPLATKPKYLKGSELMPYSEVVDRRELVRIAEGSRYDPASLRRFRAGLARYQLGAVCIYRRPKALSKLRPILSSVGFERRAVLRHYEIWARKPKTSPNGAHSPGPPGATG